MDAPLQAGHLRVIVDTYMKTLPLISWSRFAYLAGLVLALIALIPVLWFPLQLGKLALFAAALIVASALFFLGGGTGGVLGKRGLLPALCVGLLPLSYLLSYLFSTNKTVGLVGYTVEADTALFVGICFFAFLFSFFMFRRASTVRTLLMTVGGASALAVVFQFISIVAGKALFASSVFADPSVNLVGKWNDVGVLAGFALVIALVWAELLPHTKARRIQLIAGIFVLVLFLGIVQSAFVWSCVLVGAVALIGSLVIMHSRAHGAMGMLRSLPWLPIVVGLVSAAFLLWGSVFQSGIVRIFPVSSLEVRPSLSTTFDVLRASHGDSVGRFLVGTGPGTFGDTWFMHKPASINQSQFWNLDFNVGYSTFATALSTVGILGLLGWLVPLLLGLLALVRIFRSDYEAKEKVMGLSLAAGVIYLWLVALIYVPSQNMLVLAFALSGALLAFSYKTPVDAPEHAASRRMRITAAILVLICVLFVAFAGFIVGRRYFSEAASNQGLVALQSGDVNAALNGAQRAMNIEQTIDSLQFATLAGTTALTALAQSTTTPSDELKQTFAQQVQATIAVGQAAIEKNPNDYRSYALLAKVYDLLAQIGIDGAYDTATTLYATALSHNPTNPSIPLAAARLAAVRGDTKTTEGALAKSLELKSDYTDAILFAVQLYVDRKDAKNAIIAAQAAVKSAPGVPSIWFELGLLYYSSADYKNAVTAFEQAVALQNDYANAKYFLGLSYVQVQRAPDAIQQFKDLAVSNPDNDEVKLILSNLQAGKAPFDGAKPPVTPTPQSRETAPIQ